MLPTSAPSTSAPTGRPTQSPRPPTRAPLRAVSYCEAANEGAACPSDDWDVTLDRCTKGKCAHPLAAAAIELELAAAGGDGKGLILAVAVDTDLGPMGPVAAKADKCDGLPGVEVPGRGVPILQDMFAAPRNFSKYVLKHTEVSVPARLVVGWRLEGKPWAPNGTAAWEVMSEVLPNDSKSFDILDHQEVAGTDMEAIPLQALQLIVTHVRGDDAYDCRIITPIRAATAAAGLCCCLIIILTSITLATVCGCGALAMRQKAVDAVEDAPWMGTEDHVRAHVLECYETLERQWLLSPSPNVLAEAAAMLTAAQGKHPTALLRAHAGGDWREKCAAEPQLRLLPSAVVELLRRYSHEAQDTDYICGLPGAPQPFASYKAADPEHPKQAKAAWQSYKAKCSAEHGRPSVNRALYTEVNRATRGAAEGGSEDMDAWKRLAPMIKQTCLLIAAAAHAADPPLPAATGLAGRVPIVAGRRHKQRWLRMLSLPDAVRERFAGLKPGMCIAWSVGVASVTCNRKASSDFMQGGPGKCVLVRMTAPQNEARALSLGAASMYGGEGELVLALGTIFRVRRVFKGRMLSNYVQPTAATPVTLKQVWEAVRQPLVIVDVEWVESPIRWCDAARSLCNSALCDAWDLEEEYTRRDTAAFSRDLSLILPASPAAKLGLATPEPPRAERRGDPSSAAALGAAPPAAQGHPLLGSAAAAPKRGQKRGRRGKAARRQERELSQTARRTRRASSAGRRAGNSPPRRCGASYPVPEVPPYELPCTPPLAAGRHLAESREPRSCPAGSCGAQLGPPRPAALRPSAAQGLHGGALLAVPTQPSLPPRPRLAPSPAELPRPGTAAYLSPRPGRQPLGPMPEL